MTPKLLDVAAEELWIVFFPYFQILYDMIYMVLYLEKGFSPPKKNWPGILCSKQDGQKSVHTHPRGPGTAPVLVPSCTAATTSTACSMCEAVPGRRARGSIRGRDPVLLCCIGVIYATFVMGQLRGPSSLCPKYLFFFSFWYLVSTKQGRGRHFARAMQVWRWGGRRAGREPCISSESSCSRVLLIFQSKSVFRNHS